MAVTAQDVGDYITNLVPGWQLGGEEGFLWGDPGSEVSGALVAWMGTVQAIEAAAAQGCNFMLVHEQLTYPYPSRGPALEQCLHWRSNQARLSRLAKYGITVYRAHGLLDTYCILDDFGRKLGLPEPAVSEAYFRIYDIKPLTVGELADTCKAATDMPAVRVVGDMDRIVSRVGAPWGGLGLSLNVGFIEGLLGYEPDVLIGGESDEYAMFLVQDCDVPFIELGHTTSENIGLQRVAQEMDAALEDIKVIYYPVTCPWQMR